MILNKPERIGISAIVPVVPILALVFFLVSAFVQGDAGFQVDKTQHGLLISRVVAPVNPVQVGDLIIEISGVPYERILGYLFLPETSRQALDLTLMRDGRTLRLQVQTTPMTLKRILGRAGLRLLLVSFFLFLATVARFRAPDSVQVRLFFLMLCGLSTSVAATLPSCLTVLSPLVISISFLLLMVSNWFSFGAFLHFAFRFPHDRDLLAGRRWPYLFIYVFPPLFIIIASLAASHFTHTFWGWLQRLRNIFLPPIIILVFAKELWDYRCMKTPYDRKRLRPLLLAYWLSFGPYFFLYLTPNLLFDKPLISFQIVIASFMILPLAYFYVLVRHRLFDADRLLSRFISYGIVTGLIIFSYSFFLAGLKRWLFGNQMLSEELFLAFFISAIIVFHPLQRGMERLVSMLFFRHRPMPAQLLHQFSDKISGLLFLSDIVRAMIEELPQKINVDSVAIMLLGDKHSRLYPEHLRFGSSPWPKSKLAVQFRQHQVDYMKTGQAPADADLRKELKEIRKAGFSLVLPMHTAAGLSGLLFIGFRRDGRRFSMQDIHLMGALANQGAIALENARRHESLVKSKEQIEELFNERVQQEKMALVGEMTSMVAHEFKNPLGIIHSSAQYLVNKQRPIEVQREMLEYIMEEVKHLNMSIESLLTMAKQPPPKFEQIDLGHELPDLVERWINSSDHNPRVKIECRIEPYLPTMYADLRQLSQVLLNLIRNSEEMMPEGGNIVVEARSEDHLMTIRVKDNGPGIREEDKENLFKSFFTTKEGGLGLGLVVCQQIVAAHKGVIGLDNDPSGGAIAWIELPLKPLATTGLPVLPSEG